MIAALLAVFLVAPASAAGSPESALAGAFAAARSGVPRASVRLVDACFERDADPRADALELPRRFCLKWVGTAMPQTTHSPLAAGAMGLVDEGQGLRPVPISAGARTPRGWSIHAEIFSHGAAKPVCGRLNHSFASVSLEVDRNGVPFDGPVEISGFMIDGSGLCRDEARLVEFLYRRLR